MFWKKKEKKEPTNPFDNESTYSSPAPSYHSAPPSYNNSPPVQQQQQQQEYNTQQQSRYGGGGSRYNTSEVDQRNQLLAGARNDNGGYNSRGDNTDSGRRGNYPSEENDYGRGGSRGGSRGGNLYGNDDEEEDEDVQVAGMKQQIKNIKQDSLASTRLALQKINETEQNAANTMNMLGQQSSQIANVNRHLDMSKAYSDRAANSADELKQLNRSIFIPVVSNPFNRKEKKRRELEALQRDHSDHMAERDNIRQFEYESNARIQETARANNNISSGGAGRGGRSEADRRRYQFEEDSEDDAVEDEIDNNLDLLGGAVGRLKNMALTMNTELDSQNKELTKTIDKVDPLTKRLITTTDKLNRTR